MLQIMHYLSCFLTKEMNKTKLKRIFHDFALYHDIIPTHIYNPQIQISEKSQTKRLEIADSRKTKRPITDKRTTPNKRHSNAIITL